MPTMLSRILVQDGVLLLFLFSIIKIYLVVAPYLFNYSPLLANQTLNLSTTRPG